MGAGDVELVDLEDAPVQLLRAWRDRDFKLFLKILNNGYDVNAIYKEENFQPILGVLSRDKDRDVKEYAAAVLAKNADKDKRYPSGKCAIHQAAEIGNLGVMQALMEANADLNVGDQGGSTALHFLAQQKWSSPDFKICMELLLSHPDVDINVRNIQGCTPVRWALRMKNKEAVICMLDKEKDRSLIDFDEAKFRNMSTREAIINQYPDLEEMLPKFKGPTWSYIKMDASNLLYLLTEREIDRFCSAFSKEMEDKTQERLLKECIGQNTLLQYASRENIPQAVQLILEKGGDPNYAHDNTETPIHIAARCGYPEILKMLLEKSNCRTNDSIGGNSPLHSVAKYAHDSPSHHECLKMLLEKRWEKNEKFDVNAVDTLGYTPLHYSVLYNDDISTEIFLENGAYIGVENKGESPLSRMNPKVLENFLNKHMTFKSTHENETEQFEFNFSFLRPCSAKVNAEPEEKALLENRAVPNTFEQETKPILRIARSPDLRHLTTHPVLTSFTFLKWQRIRAFFYTNLAFYLTFCFLLTIYILFAYRYNPAPLEKPAENVLNLIPEKPNYHDKTNATKPTENVEKVVNNLLITLNRVLILVFLFILTLRECFQFAVSPRKYLKTAENYLELVLIALASFAVIRNCSQRFNPLSDLYYVCPQINAIVILISWIELVLLIGKHPRFSVQVEMFKTVSVSFIRFLSWYILLIIAFALSFYVLFRGCSGECDSNPFTSEGSALFKTLVMLTGEFEAGDIPFVTYVGTSHIIFTMFVFLIAIVLLNLLNGLAVADTKVIKDDAYLYSCCARVELIAFVEELFSGGTLSSVKSKCCSQLLQPLCKIFQYFAKRLALFNGFLPTNNTIIVHSLERNRVEVNHKQRNYFLDNVTIVTAKALVAAQIEKEPRKEDEKASLNVTNEKIEQLALRLIEFEKRFEIIEHSNKQIEKLLIQNMAIASLNHANSEDR